MRNSISETLNHADVREAIRARARAEGFDVCGFARAERPEGAAERLAEYLALSHHGDMSWMQTTQARRADPHVLWPDARSIITLGVNYAPVADPLLALTRRERGVVSVYAQGADYHEVLKGRLKRLASWIVQTYGGDVKIFVDTAPVMEKPLAAASGIGWQGKHTNLVARDFGSWLFLGSIFTTMNFESDPPQADSCGTCSRCLDICPTRAFPAPYTIDARRCISYLTIEHKGHIAREFREAIGNRIYGCDDCLAVCPWNKFAQASRETAFHPRIELTLPLLRELVLLDDAAFREIFRGSPVKRIGRDRFIRNVLIAIGNSGHSPLAAVVEARLSDESPLVRAMAVWALSRLVPREDFLALATKHAPAETDPDVREEWRHPLPGAPMAP
ncbi:MAG TPA: tRNA epoxyqueuosine(34) reductase QueG [Micropepsaceae bacterium]|jgi:epoxyqueuosine reductase